MALEINNQHLVELGFQRCDFGAKRFFAEVEGVMQSIGIPSMVTLLVGVSLHGLCFGCFIFVAFMIVDEECTDDVKATAQNLSASLERLAVFSIAKVNEKTCSAFIHVMKHVSTAKYPKAFLKHQERILVACARGHRHIAKMLLDRAQAEDLLQETFARAYEHRERLLSSTSFKAWLFTIARNQCLNVLRKRGREVGFAEDAPEPPSHGATPFANLLKSEQTALVTKTLGQLSPSYREVIVLREYQNLSYDEIASVTKSTVSAVKSRLFKARRQIGVLLRPWLHPDEAPGPAVPALAAQPARSL